MLPQPPAYRVEPGYAECKSLDDVIAAAGESHDIPHIPLLRYAIAELAAKKEKSTADLIFRLLEAKLPWLQTEEGAKFQVSTVGKPCSCV